MTLVKDLMRIAVDPAGSEAFTSQWHVSVPTRNQITAIRPMHNSSSLARRVVSLVLVASTICLASCASGPTYAEMKSKLPPIAKGKGRVFIYRGSSIGFLVQPKVRIDNIPVGTLQGRGFLYSDQPAGSREISIAIEWKQNKPVTVVSGQPSYVECMALPGVFVGHILPGFLVGHIIPNQVDAARGEAKIQGLRYGQK